jgi:hypothetical protein
MFIIMCLPGHINSISTVQFFKNYKFFVLMS